jgi:hypothetical protein
MIVVYFICVPLLNNFIIITAKTKMQEVFRTFFSTGCAKICVKLCYYRYGIRRRN